MINKLDQETEYNPKIFKFLKRGVRQLARIACRRDVHVNAIICSEWRSAGRKIKVKKVSLVHLLMNAHGTE